SATVCPYCVWCPQKNHIRGSQNWIPPRERRQISQRSPIVADRIRFQALTAMTMEHYGAPMTGGLLDAIQSFVGHHRACSSIIGDPTEVAAEGYAVWLRCSCGASFGQWVTPQIACGEIVNYVRPDAE